MTMRHSIAIRVCRWMGLAAFFLGTHPSRAGLTWPFFSNSSPSSFHYSARVWQTDEGLPNNRVSAIAQTADGYLWVGTSDGLARFDGLEFRVYSFSNAPALRNAAITALCADPDGALWAGLKNVALAKLDRDHCVFFTSRHWPIS